MKAPFALPRMVLALSAFLLLTQGSARGGRGVRLPQADTILAGRPTHLLGLALAMRAAPSPSRRSAIGKRLLAAESGETAAALPEYADHQHDVSAAMTAARTPGP